MTMTSTKLAIANTTKTAEQQAATTIYPASEARAIVGWSSGASNRAIERWAKALSICKLPELDRSDWMYLADTLNGAVCDCHWGPHYLAMAVEDADRLDGAGEKWYGDQARPRVARLLAAIDSMDYVQFAYVLTAVEWFWAHHPTLDCREDEWWTLGYRLAHRGESTDPE